MASLLARFLLVNIETVDSGGVHLSQRGVVFGCCLVLKAEAFGFVALKCHDL